MKLLIKYNIIRIDQSIINSQEKSNSIEQQNMMEPGENMGLGAANKMQPPYAN